MASANKERRLKKVQEKAGDGRDFVVFYYDYEGTNLYDRPHNEPGARLVMPEELERAQKTHTVILVTYGRRSS